MGQLSLAEEHLAKTLEIQERWLKPTAPELAQLREELAAVYEAQGKEAQAAELRSRNQDLNHV